MFDVKKVPATPAWARRLAKFATLNHMHLSPEILDLSVKDMISVSDLSGFGMPLDEASRRALQYIADWNYRAMLLDCGNARARSVALAGAYLQGKGTKVVLARPQEYSAWATLIRDNFPDESISMFGNPRYQEKNIDYPEGIEFQTAPDFKADWMITSYGSLIWHDCLQSVTPIMLIVEELDNSQSVNYKWQEAVKGAFMEVPKTLLIQNIKNLKQSDACDPITNLQNLDPRNNYINFVLSEFLWSHTESFAVLDSSKKGITEYLTRRKYTDLDYLNLLSVFGVSSHLITEELSSNIVNYYDNTLLSARKKKKQSGDNSSIARMAEREVELEASTGLSMGQIVEDWLAGDVDRLRDLQGLQTVPWSNLKANAIKTVMGQISNKLNKVLILAESPNLVRSLQFTFNCDNLSTSKNPNTSLARYLHPNPEWRKYAEDTIPSATSYLITNVAELSSNVDLLTNTKFMVLAEWLTIDHDTYELLKDLSIATGIKLVQVTMTGCFEEVCEKAFKR